MLKDKNCLIILLQDDRDVIEILDIVSPPKSPKSPKRVRSPVNTLQSELDVLDICQPNYLEVNFVVQITNFSISYN